MALSNLPNQVMEERLTRVVSSFIDSRRVLDKAVLNHFETAFPDKMQKIEDLRKRIFNLHVDFTAPKALKEEGGLYVDLGEAVNTRLTPSQLCMNLDVDLLMSRKVLARKAAKALRQKFHPDRPTGCSDIFNLVNELVDSGDVEMIHVLTFRYCPTSFNQFSIGIDGLLDKIEVSTEKIQATPGWRIMRLLVSGRTDEAHQESETFLNSVIHQLQSQLPGVSNAENHSTS